MRIEPPPSPTCASGTIPLATAAAEPPLDPPELCAVCHGLRVGPYASGSAVGMSPNFRCVRLADDHAARALELVEQVTRAGRHVVELPEQRVAGVVRRAREGAVEVLDEDRDAVQRAIGEVTERGRPSTVVEGMDHGVQLVVDLLDALDRGVDQLDGRHLTVADECGLGSGVEM